MHRSDGNEGGGLFGGLIPLFMVAVVGIWAVQSGGGDQGGDRPVPNDRNLSPPQTGQVENSGYSNLVNIPGVREVHAAASRKACRDIAQRFRQEGRRLTLVGRITNPKPDAFFKVICIFDGPDARDDYFLDYRYNQRSEYEY